MANTNLIETLQRLTNKYLRWYDGWHGDTSTILITHISIDINTEGISVMIDDHKFTIDEAADLAEGKMVDRYNVIDHCRIRKTYSIL